jgi:hypothetical protein
VHILLAIEMTAQTEHYQLHPTGYELHPEIEEFPLSTIDLTCVCTYNQYGFVFKLEESTDKTTLARLMKKGLEATLGQCRHLVGTIEKNETDEYIIVKKRSSTVPFAIQWMDSPSSQAKSFEEMCRLHFSGKAFGDKTNIGIEGMTFGSPCDLNSSPAVSGFKLNFIPGGMILSIHHHHYTVDVRGTHSFIKQWAANCKAIFKGTSPPSWDDAFMDRSLFITPPPSIEESLEPPPMPQKHPDHLSCYQLIFHLAKSKVAEIKRMATPTDGSWISTYDAMIALWWRISTRTRLAFYPKTDLTSKALFFEAVTMRHRLEPPLPEQLQANCLNIGSSNQLEERQQLTLSEVMSDEIPLSRLASEVRAITDSSDQALLFDNIEKVAKVRDKSSLMFRLDCFAPLSFIVTDWRNSPMCEEDWGFGRPAVFRHLTNHGFEAETIMVVSPPRTVEVGPDEGHEFLIPFEEHDIERILKDPDVVKYFDYRGLQ